MKIGDRVKVIVIDEYFDTDSNLEVGDIGTITNEQFYTESEYEEDPDLKDDDCFGVKFDKEVIPGELCKLNPDGSYNMFRCQLEVIKEEPIEETN